MPPRKTYPPASRRSQRLESGSSETPPARYESVVSTDPDNSDSEEKPVIVIDPTDPNDSEHSGQEMEDLNDQPDLAAQVAALQAEIDRLRADAIGRESTPVDSAFGGTKFAASGVAAKAAFAPYGDNQNAVNPRYSRKAKPTSIDPGTFEGNKDEFDGWIVKLADKFEEDNETFKKERSRMALINNLVSGAPQRLLRTRYESETNPYSSAAEMVQVLSTVYRNVNQASTARTKLSKMMYEPGGKLDIYQYIAEINSLADQAGIPEAERKTILWEHIPPHLDHQLLGMSQKSSVTYEEFTTLVANAAYSQQRSYELRRESRRKKEDSNDNPKNDPKPRKTPRPKPAGGKPATVLSVHRALTEDEKRVHWDAGTCFICGKSGHKGVDCPDRGEIRAVKAVKTTTQKEEKKKKDKKEEASSTDESSESEKE